MKEQIIEWTRNYLNSFGGKTKAVIGISGGKDSTIVLKLLIEAVGKDRIYAVTMPHKENGIEPEVYQIADEFGIYIHTVSVQQAYTDLTLALDDAGLEETNPVYTSNTPCRLRMVTLYGIAALLGDARVVCTSNRSEDYIGWATKWGDMAGDFAPIADLTVREVKQLGYELGISENLIEKKPDDGMCGATDEEKFGFTYEELDDYLLSKNESDFKDKDEALALYELAQSGTIEKIEKMHKASRHKFDPLPKFTKMP